MNATQPDLPAMPPNWNQPITISGSELTATIEQARADGFTCHMMTSTGARYRLVFIRTHHTPHQTINVSG